MNKKFLGIFAALVVLGSTGAFASAAIGLQYNANISGALSHGGSLTFKLSNVDAVFAANLRIDGNYFEAGLSADRWVQNPRLAGMVHYFWGPGLAGGVSIGNGDLNYIYFAGRLVAGINLFVIEPLELYLQAAGELGLGFGGSSGFHFPLWNVPVSAGFRFWF